MAFAKQHNTSHSRAHRSSRPHLLKRRQVTKKKKKKKKKILCCTTDFLLCNRQQQLASNVLWLCFANATKQTARPHADAQQ
jgi:hypothetical protein